MTAETRPTSAEPDRDATQDKGIDLFMRAAEQARWAGSEPIERDAHEGCECLLCCPPCAVEGCDDQDVTARLVPVDTTYRAMARVLLCEQHGRARPLA